MSNSTKLFLPSNVAGASGSDAIQVMTEEVTCLILFSVNLFLFVCVYFLVTALCFISLPLVLKAFHFISVLLFPAAA